MSTEYDKLYIGGQWVAPKGSNTIKVVSASTEEPIGSVPEASEADVDAAVDAARRAFDDPSGWAHWEPSARADVMERLADALEARSSDMAAAVSSQNGMPISIAGQLESGYPIMLLRYYAGLAREMVVEEERPGLMGGKTLVRRKPIGVVGAIVPWNFPQALAFFKIAPAMAAGATMVIKPSPETVLDSFLLAEIAESAGVPAGVLNFVPGGRELGAHLVSHPRIDKVAFTGSTAAGRSIAETCGRLLRPVSLELGGKSAAIVLDDADLTQNMEGLFMATMLNNGQTCFLGTRILAPQSRYDEIVQTFAAIAGGMSVGDALDPNTQIGPMASSGHRDRVEGYIAKGRAEGGKIAAGGGRPDGLNKGWFVQPTVFAGLDNNATISQEEIFGPVLTVIPYQNDDDAVRIANDSDFGLGGSVWTGDRARGEDVAKRVRTGSIGINNYLPDPTAPFGGVKASGLGRELGPEGLAAYQELQSVYRDPSA